MNSNASHFAISSTPQNVNMSLHVKKGGNLNNSFLGTGNMQPHLILQNYHGTGYPPPNNKQVTKSPQNSNNMALLSPMYGKSQKKQKQQVSSVMDQMHGTTKFMMADPSMRNQQMMPNDQHGTLMPAADLSMLNNMYTSKITSAQKKKSTRSKSK